MINNILKLLFVIFLCLSSGGKLRKCNHFLVDFIVDNPYGIVRIVQEAGHQYNSPDTAMGYGIPNIYKAYLDHVEDVAVNTYLREPLSIYPNPCSNNLLVVNPDFSIEEIQVFDVSGKLVLSHLNCNNTLIQVSTDSLSSGLYILKTTEKNKIRTAKFIKQ